MHPCIKWCIYIQRFGAFIDCEWNPEIDKIYRGSMDCFVFKFFTNVENSSNNGDSTDASINTNGNVKNNDELRTYHCCSKLCCILRNDFCSITIGAGYELFCFVLFFVCVVFVSFKFIDMCFCNFDV